MGGDSFCSVFFHSDMVSSALFKRNRNPLRPRRPDLETNMKRLSENAKENLIDLGLLLLALFMILFVFPMSLVKEIDYWDIDKNLEEKSSTSESG